MSGFAVATMVILTAALPGTSAFKIALGVGVFLLALDFVPRLVRERRRVVSDLGLDMGLPL